MAISGGAECASWAASLDGQIGGPEQVEWSVLVGPVPGMAVNCNTLSTDVLTVCQGFPTVQRQQAVSRPGNPSRFSNGSAAYSVGLTQTVILRINDSRWKPGTPKAAR